MEYWNLDGGNRRLWHGLTQDVVELVQYPRFSARRCFEFRQDIEGELTGEDLVFNLEKIEKIDGLLLKLIHTGIAALRRGFQNRRGGGLQPECVVQHRQYSRHHDRRRMRIHEITMTAKQPRIGNSMQIHVTLTPRLSQINRQVGKSRSAREIRLHDFRAACKERDVDVAEGVGRNHLRDLDVARKLLQQSRVFFRLQQGQLADGKSARLQHV